DPSGYIFTWLIGYSALLGPVAAIMIADYFVVRKRHLEVAALYTHHGIYGYRSGFNPGALVALALAVLLNVPGFFVQVRWLDAARVPGFMLRSYDKACFTCFVRAFGIYLGLARVFPPPVSAGGGGTR